MSVDDLLQAASAGNISEVTKLLDRGIPIDGLDSYGSSALIKACNNSTRDNADIVRLLLSRGANVNLSNKYGRTTLHYACHYGHVSTAELLLDSGADHSVQDNDGNTPLHYACRGGELQVAELLLRRGASHTCRNKKGEAPLETCEDSAMRTQLQAVFNSLSGTRAPAPSAKATTTGGVKASILAPPPPAHTASASIAAAAPARAPVSVAALEDLQVQLALVTSERDALQLQLTQITNNLTEKSREKDTLTALLAQRDDLVAEQRRLNNELVLERNRLSSQRDNLLETLAALQARVNEELMECRRERDAALAERDQLRAQVGAAGASAGDVCPFIRYQPHVFVPGVVPPGSGPGMYDVAANSSLFLYLRQLCDTGGSWMLAQRPVAGFRLARVQAVVPEAFVLGGYTNAQGRMNSLRATGLAQFNHDNQGFTPAQLHVLNVLREAFQEKAPGCSNRTANTLHCYHGPRREHVESICSNGMVSVRKMDEGFFGVGCYTTLNMEYALKYAYGDFDMDPVTGVATGPRPSDDRMYPVIMLAATVGMAYPVTREVDYPAGSHTSQFLGRGLKSGFDTHVVCVNQLQAYQAVPREYCEYVELVIAQEAQLLPLAVLWFEKI